MRDFRSGILVGVMACGLVSLLFGPFAGILLISAGVVAALIYFGAYIRSRK